jgi:hypothetical protein
MECILEKNHNHRSSSDTSVPENIFENYQGRKRKIVVCASEGHNVGKKKQNP